MNIQETNPRTKYVASWYDAVCIIDVCVCLQVNAISRRIAYPDFIKSDSKLDEYYKEVIWFNVFSQLVIIVIISVACNCFIR